MGFAVAGMHYTAMSASLFHEIPGAHTPGSVFSDAVLAGSIGGFAGIILGLSIMAAWIDRKIGFERLLHLEKMAHTDGLTGLPNRVMFQDQLEAARNHSSRHGDRFGLLFIDLDKFKPINDTLGHAAGDRVLKEVASRIRATLRGEDVAARLGGDEFVILVRDISAAEDIVEVAERLLSIMKKPISLDARTIPIAASVGISICPDDGMVVEELKEKADAAMYRAKTEGLGYCFADSAIAERAVAKVRFGSDLQVALDRSQLVLEYQPWVDMNSRHWLGVEALARWPHPQGDIPPSELVPLAERCGLAQKFGEWTLRAACKQGKAWLENSLEFGNIAVNISEAHFAQDNFLERLQTILEETRFPGNRLELEINESCIIDGSPALTERLASIRALGVALVIDNFGAGYTFLGYLKDASIDRVKLDRSLVANLPGSRKDLAIIRAVVGMGSGLEFAVVGKGIETEEQCDALIKAGCPQGQGYLFARPRPGEGITQALSRAPALV